jgi:hypothetical protein
MLSGEFQRKLRAVNSNLRIWCSDQDFRAAGIYKVNRLSEYEEVCGIDKNFVPELTTQREDGLILKGGWRRAMNILIRAKLVDRRKAERVFNTRFDLKTRKIVIQYESEKIKKAIEKATVENMVRTGKPALSRDQVMDFAKEVNKEGGLEG